jgi:hypothetical protein
MVGYCPNCGVEVNEGHKFCLNCGAELGSSTFDEQVAQTPTVAPVPTQQPYGQTQGYMPMQPKKSNMKIIIALIAIIVVVVVVILAVFFLLGGGADSRFVGEWEYTITPGYSLDMKFNSDGSVAIGYNDEYGGTLGEWEVEGDQLCVSGEGGQDRSCMKYTFSNNGNTLTLENFPSIGTITFTKK